MFDKILKFMKEVRMEMSKVAWPTRAELVSSTSVVLVISAAFALFIFIFDMFFSRIMEFVLR